MSYESLLIGDFIQSNLEIGKGEHSVVYRGSLRGLQCAGKKVLLAQDSCKDSFHRECVLHSNQRHPNIVQLLGIWLSPEPVLVTELFPMNLSSCLESHKDLQDPVKADILLSVTKGLNFLHDRPTPIPHLGLSSENILLTSHFQAKISDLSTSRFGYDGGAVIHHSVFMPPELLSGGNGINELKVDVFSFGCIAIHVISQCYPTPSKQVLSQSEWKRRECYLAQTSSLSSIVPIVKRSLATEPNERPEISEAMKSIEDTATCPPSTIEELERSHEKYTSVIYENPEEESSQQSSNNVNIVKQLQETKSALSASRQNASALQGKLSTCLSIIDELKQNSMLKENIAKLLENQVKTANENMAKVKESCDLELSRMKEALETERANTSDSTKALIALQENAEKLQKDLDVSNSTVNELQHKVNCYLQKISTLEEEIVVLDTNLKKMEASAKNNEELEGIIAVCEEDQSRLEIIMFNQQAQIDSLHQQLGASKNLVENLQEDAAKLQGLLDSAINEKTNIVNKHQSEVAALTSALELCALKENSQKLEIDVLKEKNKHLKENAHSLTSSLDTTNKHLTNLRQLTNELLRKQDEHLKSIDHIKPPLMAQQKKIIDSMKKQRFIEGDTWCLVSTSWYDKWVKYTDMVTETIPGPVTNSVLLIEKNEQDDICSLKLKDGLKEGFDYTLLPEIAWDLLISWYGLEDKSQRIARHVIKIKKQMFINLFVEVYPVKVNVHFNSTIKPFSVMLGDTAVSVTTALKKLLYISNDTETRIWLQHGNDVNLLAETDTMGCNSSHWALENDDVLLLDTKLGDKWSLKAKTAAIKEAKKTNCKVSCFVPNKSSLILGSAPKHYYDNATFPSLPESPTSEPTSEDDYEYMTT